MKKIFGFALILCSQQVLAFGECKAVTIAEILAGPQYKSMIRVNDENCGSGGWVCINTEKAVTEEMSNKIFSLAMAAKATGTTIDVRWSEGSANHGCNGSFPMVYDFRVN